MIALADQRLSKVCCPDRDVDCAVPFMKAAVLLKPSLLIGLDSDLSIDKGPLLQKWE